MNNIPDNPETFAWLYFRTEQTILVKALLEQTNPIELYQLYNENDYTADLSTGIFNGNHYMLLQEQENVRLRLNKAVTDSRAYQTASDDLERLESASYQAKTVYEWYAVPYWIADFFIRSGEVVLIWQGLCWWGRTEAAQYVYRDNIVQELFILNKTNSGASHETSTILCL